MRFCASQFYAALWPFRSPYLGSNSFELYRKTYDSLQYPVKEWQDIFRVRKPVSVSSYIGMVQSFSTFQTLLKKDPEEARRLSQDTEQRLLRAMGVTSSETEVFMDVKYIYFLACKENASLKPQLSDLYRCQKMAVRLFEDKEHANSYWKYRISPSEELIDKVLQFLRRNNNSASDLAVDVGCGSGQGTLLLAPHFTRVVGTDISSAQLEVARKHVKFSNISYRESPAEELPFEDGSVDLVTTMSAFHWFDQLRFLQEVHRVLKPHGCLAILNYTMDMELSYGDCSETLNHICKEFYAALWPFRSPYLGSNAFELYRKTYDSLQYPVKEWQEIFRVRKPVSVSSYIGMVQSFSTFQTLLKKDPEEARRLSQDTEQRLLRAMGVTSSETEVFMDVKYIYFLACKSAND